MSLDGINFITSIIFVLIVAEYIIMCYIAHKHDKPNTSFHDDVVEEYNKRNNIV